MLAGRQLFRAERLNFSSASAVPRGTSSTRGEPRTVKAGKLQSVTSTADR
jgi:hypothetical protein